VLTMSQTPTRDVVAKTTAISARARDGHREKALGLRQESARGRKSLATTVKGRNAHARNGDKGRGSVEGWRIRDRPLCNHAIMREEQALGGSSSTTVGDDPQMAWRAIGGSADVGSSNASKAPVLCAARVAFGVPTEGAIRRER